MVRTLKDVNNMKWYITDIDRMIVKAFNSYREARFYSIGVSGMPKRVERSGIGFYHFHPKFGSRELYIMTSKAAKQHGFGDIVK
jgi:hypothetical protein